MIKLVKFIFFLAANVSVAMHFSNNAENIFNNENFSDLKITYLDQEYYVSKAIMALNSEYFLRSFNQSFRESSENILNMTEAFGGEDNLVTTEDFEDFLKLFYGIKPDNINSELYEKICILHDYFECNMFLLQQLKEDLLNILRTSDIEQLEINQAKALLKFAQSLSIQEILDNDVYFTQLSRRDDLFETKEWFDYYERYNAYEQLQQKHYIASEPEFYFILQNSQNFNIEINDNIKFGIINRLLNNISGNNMENFASLLKTCLKFNVFTLDELFVFDPNNRHPYVNPHDANLNRSYAPLLTFAVCLEHVGYIEVILAMHREQNITINIRTANDGQGRLPIDFAREKNNEHIINLLENF